jgi:hypothetical protein
MLRKGRAVQAAGPLLLLGLLLAAAGSAVAQSDGAAQPTLLAGPSEAQPTGQEQLLPVTVSGADGPRYQPIPGPKRPSGSGRQQPEQPRTPPRVPPSKPTRPGGGSKPGEGWDWVWLCSCPCSMIASWLLLRLLEEAVGAARLFCSAASLLFKDLNSTPPAVVGHCRRYRPLRPRGTGAMHRQPLQPARRLRPPPALHRRLLRRLQRRVHQQGAPPRRSLFLHLLCPAETMNAACSLQRVSR